MANVQRFRFETFVDGDEVARRPREPQDAAPAPPAEAPPPPTFSAADLAEARREGHAAGLEAGRQEATATIERDAAAALQAIGRQIADLIEARRAADAALAGQAAEVALAIARKMLPALMRQHGAAEIEAVVRGCLADRLEEPRIVIRVADERLDPIKAGMTEIARELGYDGAVVLLADRELGPADVKVEWADGGAERRSNRLWADIEAAVARLTDAGTAARPADRAATPNIAS